MNDYVALAQQLIKALEQSRDANIASLQTQRETGFEQITNQRAARGTLYNTGTGYQQLQFDAGKIQPAIAEQQQGALLGKIQIKSDLLDTSRKIKALNRSAKELAGIKFDKLLT